MRNWKRFMTSGRTSMTRTTWASSEGIHDRSQLTPSSRSGKAHMKKTTTAFMAARHAM